MPVGRLLGRVPAGGSPRFSWQGSWVDVAEVYARYRNRLEKVYPTLNPEWDWKARMEITDCGKETRLKDRTETFLHEVKSWPVPAIKTAKPKVLVPAFPGTNCEYDSARAVENVGAESEIFVVRNRSAEEIAYSAEAFAEKVRESQIIFIPGGFSGGSSGGFGGGGWQCQIHYSLLQKSGSEGCRYCPAGAAGRSHVRHLQWLPGADQAGIGSIRKDY